MRAPCAGVCSVESKHLFFSGFLFHAGNIDAMQTPASSPRRVSPGRCGAAMNGDRIFFRRAVAFRRCTTPIARNCASPSAPRDGDRRTSERPRCASSGDEPGATGCIRDARSMHAMIGTPTPRRRPLRQTRRSLAVIAGGIDDRRPTTDERHDARDASVCRKRRSRPRSRGRLPDAPDLARCRDAISARRLRAARRSRPGRAVR